MFIEDSNEIAQNKLILLYILKTAEDKLSNSELTQYVLENSTLNYFAVQQLINELADSDFIKSSRIDDVVSYEIASFGDKSLEFFTEKIPESSRNKIDKHFKQQKLEKIKNTQIVGDYYKKSENDYMVNLKVVENELTLFNMSINVVSKKQAKILCKNWKANSTDIYKNIMDMLSVSLEPEKK